MYKFSFDGMCSTQKQPKILYDWICSQQIVYDPGNISSYHKDAGESTWKSFVFSNKSWAFSATGDDNASLYLIDSDRKYE